MSNWRGNEEECPVCGLKYKKLRTGHSYADIRMMLWIADEDYSKWKYKRRNTVLGLWWQIKQAMWKQHLLECEEMLMYYEAQEVLEGELTELVEVVLEDAPF